MLTSPPVPNCDRVAGQDNKEDIMKVQLLTATILLLGVVAGSAGPNQNAGNAPGSSPSAGKSGRQENSGYLTGPMKVSEGDVTLRSSAGMQPVGDGTTNERALICDPSKQLRVGDHCVALGPD